MSSLSENMTIEMRFSSVCFDFNADTNRTLEGEQLMLRV